MTNAAQQPEITIDTKAALYKQRWEDEQRYALDLAHQVDQLRAANADLVARHNALVEEIERLRGEGDGMPVEPEPIAPDLAGGAAAETETIN